MTPGALVVLADMDGKKAKAKGVPSVAPVEKKPKRKKTPMGPDWQGVGFQFIYYFPQILSGMDAREPGDDDDFHLQELLEASERIGQCFERYINHEVSTLDEAFEVARPKGYRRAVEKRRMEKRYPIRRDAHHLIAAGARVDSALFEALGRLHGIGATKAAEFYYSFDYPTPARDENAKVPAYLQKYLDELLG